MKRPPREEQRLDDEDIASVFAAQKVDVPDDLMNSVLEEAQRQLNLDAEKGTDFLAAHDHSTHTNNVTGVTSKEERAKSHSLHSRSRWLAVAATMLVAIAVTPLLLNSPDSSLNDGGAGTYEVDSAASVATQEAEAAPDDSTSSPSATAVESSASAAAPSEVPMAAEQSIATDQIQDDRAARSAPEALRQRRSDNVATSTADKTSSEFNESSGTIAYRQNADNWIEEIQRLINQNEARQAETEYRLFEKQHPDRARDFKPDFSSD